MVWDATLPSGSLSIAQGDDDIRANNDAVEAALTLEHRFATGGNQSGRHVFTRDTAANIALLANVADGSIAFDNDTVASDRPVLRVYNGSSWEYVGAGDPSHPVVYSNATGRFTVAQWAQWTQLTVTAGTPDTVTPDLTGTPYLWFAASDDTQIVNPTVPSSPSVSGYGTSFIIDVEMDGTGGHAITFGNQYRAPSGVALIDTQANGKTRLYINRDRNGNFIVNTSLNFAEVIA